MEQLFNYIIGIKYGDLCKYWKGYITYNIHTDEWLVHASMYDVCTEGDKVVGKFTADLDARTVSEDTGYSRAKELLRQIGLTEIREKLF